LTRGTVNAGGLATLDSPQATDLYAFQDLAGSGSISSVTVTAKAAVIGPKPPKLCFDQPQPCYGNIDLLVKLPGTVHTYSNGPSGMNELTLIRRADGTSTAFGYDPNGNLRSRTPAPAPRTGVECYDWNREGLLVSVRDVATDCGETGTQVQRYAYDGRGSRVKVEGTSGGTWTVSVFSGQEVLFEKDETGRTTKYVYAAGMRIARIDCTPHPNGPSYPSSCLTYYYHGDALGSTRKRTWHHPSVAVTFSAEYEPFGRAYTVQGSEAYKYTGEKHDDPTGLVYLRARQYDPDLGRFVSADPVLGALGMPQTLNRYAYVVNNPLKYTDPSGACIWDLCIAEAILIGAAIGAGIGVGYYAATTPQEQWTWEGAGQAAGLGAIGGAVFGATLGAAAPALAGLSGGALAGGLFAAGFGAGVAAYNVEMMAEYAWTGTYEWTPEGMLWAGAFGGATTVGGYYGGKTLSRWLGPRLLGRYPSNGEIYSEWSYRGVRVRVNSAHGMLNPAQSAAHGFTGTGLMVDDVERAIVRNAVRQVRAGNFVVGQVYREVGPVAIGRYLVGYSGRYLAQDYFAVATYYMW